MDPRRRARFVLLAVTVLVGALVVPALGAADDGEPGRFIVTTDADDPPSERELRDRGARDVQPLGHTPDRVVAIGTERAAQRIRDLAGVVAVERDEVLTVQHHRADHCGGPEGQRPDHCDGGDTTDTGAIAGTVTDADTSEALAGATVAVVDTGQAGTTDTDGTYTITDVPTGDQAVTASADGYEDATETVTVNVGETATADFALAPVAVADEQTNPWGLTAIGAPTAWETTAGTDDNGEPVRVCVADTGIDRDHEDLPHAQGRNFSTGNPHGRNVDPGDYDDGHGHGTHVAGTVAARDNALGVVGVAHATELVVAKVLRDNGSGYTSQIIDGLNWCAEDVGDGPRSDVINMSFGGGGTDALADTIESIAAQGVVLLAASGNDGAATPACPACYQDVIAVGASDAGDTVAAFSNRGEDVNAPGVDVLSTLPDDDYAAWSGTSMATPHASGVAALLLAVGTDPARVDDELIATADPIDDGAGGEALRIDAASAVAP